MMVREKDFPARLEQMMKEWHAEGQDPDKSGIMFFEVFRAADLGWKLFAGLEDEAQAKGKLAPGDFNLAHGLGMNRPAARAQTMGRGMDLCTLAPILTASTVTTLDGVAYASWRASDVPKNRRKPASVSSSWTIQRSLLIAGNAGVNGSPSHRRSPDRKM